MPAAAAARAAALLLAAAALCVCLAPAAANEVARDDLAYPPDQNRDGEPVMTVTKATIGGRDVYFEVPQNPVGVLAFFHGCNHNGYDSWYKQKSCPECRGLPGEVSITKQALAMGYAVIAPNSADRSTKCYSHSGDKDGINEVMKKLIPALNLQDVPLYLSGVSSGASFAVKFANDYDGDSQLGGILSVVLAVDPEKDDVDWGNYPPTAFIAMIRDPGTVARIRANQAALRDAGVPAQTIMVHPRVVYWPSFFSDQADQISKQLSGDIVLALIDLQVVDDLGNVVANPRDGFKFNWATALQRRVPQLTINGNDPASSLQPDSSVVFELMNTAWANHEIDGDYTTAVLKWFELGADSTDLNQLAQEYIIRKPALLTGARLLSGEKPPTAGDPPVQPWLEWENAPGGAPDMAPEMALAPAPYYY